MNHDPIPTEEFSSDKFYAGLLGLDENGDETDVKADRKAERLREWNESHR